jgi:hypothetical protein
MNFSCARRPCWNGSSGVAPRSFQSLEWASLLMPGSASDTASQMPRCCLDTYIAVATGISVSISVASFLQTLLVVLPIAGCPLLSCTGSQEAKRFHGG